MEIGTITKKIRNP